MVSAMTSIPGSGAIMRPVEVRSLRSIRWATSAIGLNLELSPSIAVKGTLRICDHGEFLGDMPFTLFWIMTFPRDQHTTQQELTSIVSRLLDREALIKETEGDPAKIAPPMPEAPGHTETFIAGVNRAREIARELYDGKLLRNKIDNLWTDAVSSGVIDHDPELHLINVRSLIESMAGKYSSREWVLQMLRVKNEEMERLEDYKKSRAEDNQQQPHQTYRRLPWGRNRWRRVDTETDYQ